MDEENEIPTAISAEVDVPVRIPTTPYTLRWTRPERLSAAEVEEIASLLTRAFNGKWGWSEPRSHLQWKLFEFPGEAALRLINDGDRIIGTQLRLWRRFQLGGAECAATEGVDEALDPEYQGRRLKSLRRAIEDPRELSSRCFSFGFGTHPTSASRRGLPRERVPLATRLETWSKPLSLRGLVHSRLRKRADNGGESRTAAVLDARQRRPLLGRVHRQLGTGTRVLASLLARRRPPHQPEGVTISAIDRFGPELGDFWPEAAKPFTLIQVRDVAFLNWRYSTPAGGSFVIRRAERKGRMLGYCALRVDANEAVLADMLALPDRLDVARALLDDAIHIARRSGAPHLRTWMTDTHPYRPLIEEAGFITRPRVMTFNCRPRDCNIEELAALSEPGATIHMMLGDTDHI